MCAPRAVWQVQQDVRVRLVHSACIYFIRMAAALIQIFVKKTGQLTINCIVSTQTHTFLNTFPFCTNASNIFKNFPIFLSIQFFNNFFHNFSCRARRYTEPKTCYWLFIQTHTQLFCMCFFFFIFQIRIGLSSSTHLHNLKFP